MGRAAVAKATRSVRQHDHCPAVPIANLWSTLSGLALLLPPHPTDTQCPWEAASDNVDAQVTRLHAYVMCAARWVLVACGWKPNWQFSKLVNPLSGFLSPRITQACAFRPFTATPSLTAHNSVDVVAVVVRAVTWG